METVSAARAVEDLKGLEAAMNRNKSVKIPIPGFDPHNIIAQFFNTVALSSLSETWQYGAILKFVNRCDTKKGASSVPSANPDADF